MQSKQEWNEEDEDIIEWLIGYLEYQIMNATITEEKDNCLDAISMLKSISSKNRWKPSEEQMHYLSWIANVKLGDSVVEQEVSKHLNELYNDLKKLK